MALTQIKRSAKRKAPTTKAASKRNMLDTLPQEGDRWIVRHGELQPIEKKRGRPPKASQTERLFKVVAEKIPFEYLSKVKADMISRGLTHQGVYVAHDSMGCPRYIGRGDIFTRLALRKKRYDLELVYFSFYVVADKCHEREIETLLIRSASFLLHFNDKKKRIGIECGSINDYEPKTLYYERHDR